MCCWLVVPLVWELHYMLLRTTCLLLYTKFCASQNMICSCSNNNITFRYAVGGRGSTVVKVLCYKSEGRWFHSRWCHRIFHWHKILPIALWPWSRLIFKQKWVPGAFLEGKGSRCLRLTTLPPSCAVVMKSGNLNFLEPSGPVQACNGISLPSPYAVRIFLFVAIIQYRSGSWNSKMLAIIWLKIRHTFIWLFFPPQNDI